MSDFEASVSRLITRVGHWEQGRWARPATSPGQTRGDVVHALVQRLADLAADAEGRARREVPRLHDMVLPDQIRVMADDLLAAHAPAADAPGTGRHGSGALDAAAVLVDAARAVV